MSDSLQPHESQHARPPCPSPTPGVHSDSRSLTQWWHPAISSSVVPSPPAPNPSQHQSLFQWVNSFNESTLPMSQPPMRWPKNWSFSFSIIPSKEIPELISFRMDWLDLLHFMANRRVKSRSSDRVYFLRLQNHCGQWLKQWSQDACSLEGKLWQT